jgi:hypothetical protein
MMSRKAKRKMSNVTYTFSEDGLTCYGRLQNGNVFLIDAIMHDKIKNINFYRNYNRKADRKTYVIDSSGIPLHRHLLEHKNGYEIDHINLDTFDNRLCNLRYCTHQQNQCNQPLQSNNTSGVTGVSYYAPRGKYRARIKIFQHDIHLGYYVTFNEAVQARNVGMNCMFGEYGIYNKTETTPEWIIEKVVIICKRFVELSLCKAFVDYVKNIEEVNNE